MRKPNDMGTTFNESVLHFVELLIQKRDHAGAVDYYEANREQLNTADSNTRASVLRHVARAQASLNRYPAAIETARTAQALAEEDDDNLLLAEVFLTTAHILVDMGEPKEAERAYRDAESIFRRQDCSTGQVRALNHLAGLFFRLNNFRNSLAVLMDAAEISRKIQDRKQLAYIMGNIGRIYTFIGDFAGAEKHLTMNIDLSTEMSDLLEVGRARLSLAYVHIQTGQYDKAESDLALALPRIVSQKGRDNEIAYLTYLGELQYRTDRLDESRDTLNQALTLARQIAPESSSVAIAMRHLAELNLRAGNYRLAQKMAAGAMVIQEKLGAKVEIGALYRIKGQIAAAAGRAEAAEKAFEKAIQIFDESGVRWEKTETFVVAASAKVLPRRRSLTFLFRAEEFYSRRRLTSRLNRVGKLISALGFEKTTPKSPESDSQSDTPQADYLTRCKEIKLFKTHLKAFAGSDLPILLTGETGVGKDHMARCFHSHACPDRPYVAVNCASVPETLLESELFGYKKGAFTGADRDKPGMFSLANGGVLFLDEIGEMPLSLQAKLLGVLERRKVVPLGGVKEVDLDFKLVTATNCDLEKMVEEGRFRRDLYYRISGVSFHIPPLRDRIEDIPLLLNQFMTECGLLRDGQPLSPELTRSFISYDWPGNIRELQNKVKRLEVMAKMTAEGDLIEVARSMFGANELPPAEDGSLFERVEEFERQLIMEAILAASGNKSEAARMLGIHEATVRTKLKRYGIYCETGAQAAETEQAS